MDNIQCEYYLITSTNTACYYNVFLYHGRRHNNNNNNYQIDIIEEIQVMSDSVFEMEVGNIFLFLLPSSPNKIHV